MGNRNMRADSKQRVEESCGGIGARDAALSRHALMLLTLTTTANPVLLRA
jgi:hypothetical protein